MPRKLSKTVEEYLAAGGWSSHHFLEHAETLFADPTVQAACTFEIGRHVIYAKKDDKIALKLYVHHNGRSREWVTITDPKGKELVSIHCSEPVSIFKKNLLNLLYGPVFGP